MRCSGWFVFRNASRQRRRKQEDGADSEAYAHREQSGPCAEQVGQATGQQRADQDHAPGDVHQADGAAGHAFGRLGEEREVGQRHDIG